MFLFFIVRLQQQQQQQQPEPITKQTKPVCSKSSNRQIVSDNRIPTTGDLIKDNESHYDSTSGESDDAESLEIWSHEIPVWIKGEQRWISGVTDQTTCLDLIEALLIDEGVIQNTNDDNNNINNTGGSGSSYPSKVNDYVIIERWRRVEQILEGRTKIYKIWMAWGEEQSEVRK